MSRRIALVAASTATEPPPLMAARVRHLVERGWDARLLCRGEPWASDGSVRALGERRELSAAGDGQLGPFDHSLTRLRPDLVHFHAAWAAWKAAGVLDELACPIVVSLRDDGRDLEIPDPERVASVTALLLCPSKAVLDRAVDRGWPAQRAAVLELPAMDSAGSAERTPRHGPLRLLSFGPLIWEHGLEHAIHGVAIARRRGADCTLRIVGAGDHLHAVAFARRQLGLEDHVEIVRPDHAGPLADELAAADVLVDPAVALSLPQAPLAAAQGHGIPFVATRRPDLPALGGIAVERRDPVAIADAVERLADDGALERMRAEAEQGRPALSVAGHLERLEQLYLRVLDQAAAASVTSAAT